MEPKKPAPLYVGDMPRPEDTKMGLDSNGNPVHANADGVHYMTTVAEFQAQCRLESGKKK